MDIREENSAFDVLAILGALLTKEEERECAIKWAIAQESQIKYVLDRFYNFLKIVLKSCINEYKFDKADIEPINSVLHELRQESTEKYEIYLLAIELEKRLDQYSDGPNKGVVHRLEPLNVNATETGIRIYPHTPPLWKQDKSERKREWTLNAKFKHYMMIREHDISPFQLVMYYYNDKGFLRLTESGWELPIAISPVMDYVQLDTISNETKGGTTIQVKGLLNEEVVTKKVLATFDDLYQKHYSMIVFPEALGTSAIVEAIKKRMQIHPDRYTMVILPTVCDGQTNRLTVLGPGGVECLCHDKAVPFIALSSDGQAEREQLIYDNHIHLLVTQELGIIAFPICAELLDPAYYSTLTDIAMVDTIICPSFSPGTQAFLETMGKGLPKKILELYINTCSAKAVSRKGEVSDPLGMVQLPYTLEESPLMEFKKECTENCSSKICYFDMVIAYRDEQFFLERIHYQCA